MGYRGELSAIRAAAAKVEREFFYLFARFRVEGDLRERHPAIVAGVGALVLVVVILGRWVRGCARLRGVHWGPFPLVRVPRGGNLVGAIYVVQRIIIRLWRLRHFSCILSVTRPGGGAWKS